MMISIQRQILSTSNHNPRKMAENDMLHRLAAPAYCAFRHRCIPWKSVQAKYSWLYIWRWHQAGCVFSRLIGAMTIKNQIDVILDLPDDALCNVHSKLFLILALTIDRRAKIFVVFFCNLKIKVKFKILSLLFLELTI